MLVRTLDPKGVDFEIPHRLGSNKHVLKTLRGSRKRESSKRTLSTSGGLRLLQMISEPDTGRYANEEAKPGRAWT